MQGLSLTPDTILFGVLAFIAVCSSVGVVAFKSAVRSAVSLVMTMFTLAIIYFTLNAEMLGIMQVVVYAGAIMVLFLFVIMLLSLGAPQLLKEKTDLKIGGGIVFGLAFLALIATQAVQPLAQVSEPRALDGYGAPEPIGRALFSIYAWPFEIASILLLIGIVGSILLAKRKI